jgi:hypothetical protein
VADGLEEVSISLLSLPLSQSIYPSILSTAAADGVEEVAAAHPLHDDAQAFVLVVRPHHPHDAGVRQPALRGARAKREKRGERPHTHFARTSQRRRREFRLTFRTPRAATARSVQRGTETREALPRSFRTHRVGVRSARRAREM